MEIKYIVLYTTLITSLTSIHGSNKPTIQFPVPNSMPYPSNQASDNQYNNELPFEDTFSRIISVNKDDIDNFEQLKKSGIPFLRKESYDDPDSSGILGYFWNIKNTDDKLQYGGIARVEQEIYVNVVAVPAHNVSDQNQTDIANAQTDAKHAKSGKFNMITNPFIGSYVGKYDGKTYYLYGRYANTIIPVDSLDADGKYTIENT